MIAENLKYVKEQIKIAAEKSGRSEKDILLLGVTKTVDVERIKELIGLGVKELGENRVQELTEKYEQIGDDVDWHLIGHLQTNKVKYIIDKVKLIHSVDSIKLAEEIDRQAKKHNKVMDILIEINIGRELSKHGIYLENTEEFIDKLSNFRNVCVKGLMTVAPFVENPQENRHYFKQMRKKFIDIEAKKHDNVYMTYLSMGMTNDYCIAIEEGANIVRIGTGLFGVRNYN